jgi:hypothetical protein
MHRRRLHRMAVDQPTADESIPRAGLERHDLLEVRRPHDDRLGKDDKDGGRRRDEEVRGGEGAEVWVGVVLEAGEVLEGELGGRDGDGGEAEAARFGQAGGSGVRVEEDQRVGSVSAVSVMIAT